MSKKKSRKGPRRDIVDPQRRPEESINIDGAVWWESNADKSKRFSAKQFKNKKFLTLKQAEVFLGLDGGDWMNYFMHGLRGFPKLPFDWDQKNPRTLKFARSDLVEYRRILLERKFSTKTKSIKK